MALKACTDMETFVFAVKGKPAHLMSSMANSDMAPSSFMAQGKPEHPMNGFVVASEKANWYLLHGMRRDALDIVKEFKSHILADLEGKYSKYIVFAVLNNYHKAWY